jgi:hypothetical protein
VSYIKLRNPKLIHSDQKGFVKGRNISEANRLIQDVIEYTDREDDDGIIIFLDQQKAFDRVEWGWVDHVLSKFNFGEKFRALFHYPPLWHSLQVRPVVCKQEALLDTLVYRTLKYLDTKPLVLIQVCAYLNNI